MIAHTIYIEIWLLVSSNIQVVTMMANIEMGSTTSDGKYIPPLIVCVYTLLQCRVNGAVLSGYCNRFVGYP